MNFPFLKPKLDHRFIPVYSAEQLLSQGKNLEAVNAIKRTAGLSDDLFNQLYHHALTRVASLVQSCPASEAHHHAFPGGLLTHILESSANALRLRKARILPVGASAENASRRRDLYTYAVFAATILHDIAKPLTDQKVTVHDRKGRYLFVSDPAYTDITDHKKAAWITIEFNSGRVYRHHQHSALIFITRILPREGYEWLLQDKDVYSEFLDAFSDNPTGPIFELMSKGDQISVSRALGARAPSQFASQRPLSLKIKTAIRFLIDSGELSLNRPGASGWVTDRGLWLVSKRAIDAIRDQLTKEGHTGIPTDNARMFDILAEGGLLELTEAQKAIWRCRVSSGTWRPNPFTLLLLPLNVVWNDTTTAPRFDGDIEVLTDTEKTTASDTAPDSPIPDTAPTPATSPTAPASPTPAPAEDDAMNTWTTWVQGLQDTSQDDPMAQTSTGNNETATKQSPTTGSGQRFRQWVENGINRSILPVNTSAALIHILTEGVFIVSPLIFKTFAKEFGLDWEDVQRDFQRLKLNLKHPQTEENPFTVRVTGPTGRISALKGWLIPFDNLSLERPLDPNPLLTLLVDKDQR